MKVEVISNKGAYTSEPHSVPIGTIFDLLEIIPDFDGSRIFICEEKNTYGRFKFYTGEIELVDKPRTNKDLLFYKKLNNDWVFNNNYSMYVTFTPFNTIKGERNAN